MFPTKAFGRFWKKCKIRNRQSNLYPLLKEKKKQQQVADPSPFLAAEKVTDKQSPAGNRLVVPSTEEEIPLTDIEFDNAAELRKAVIYTEILNRKY